MFSKLFLSLTAAFVLFSGSANAATITVTLGAVNTYALTGTLTPNIYVTDPSVAVLNNSGIANAGSNIYYGSYNPTTSPSGTLYGGQYAYVSGVEPASIAVSLASGQNTFGLTWGTIDDYNSLIIYGTNGTYTITGADLLSNVSGLVENSSQLDVLFVNPYAPITSVLLLSTENSFEVANFYAGGSVQVVPLPAAFVLFASGLVGVGGAAARKKARG